MPGDIFHRFDGHQAIAPVLAGSDEDALVALARRPALIRIPGTDPHPVARFSACLLHGNEDSGYHATLDVLRSGRRFAFDWWVLIGNVRAASQDGWYAHRYLDDQEDFNRVWGLGAPTTRMRRAADQVLEVLAEVDLQAAVDLHNNTGNNPWYAVAPRPTKESLALCATVADTALLWGLRVHTLMETLSQRCPAIAIECSLPGVPANTAFAKRALLAFLDAEDFELDREPERVFELRHRVVVRPEVPFVFGGQLDEALDLVLHPALDGFNFGMILAGTELGRVHPGAAMPLLAQDMHGMDVTERYFVIRHDRVVAAQDFTPVMATTTALQTRRDCLLYGARRRS